MRSSSASDQPRRALPAFYRLGTFVALVILALASRNASASHSTFTSGDVILGGQTPTLVIITSRIDWFHADGSFNKRLVEAVDDFPDDFAFDATGNLYAVTSYAIRVFDPAGNYVGDFGTLPPFAARAMTFDAAGHAYVAANTPSGNLVMLDASGVQLRSFALPGDSRVGGPGISSIDLGSDQCTLFYAAHNRIGRFNVCTNSLMADVTSALPGSGAASIRVLPGGNLLVAAVETIDIVDVSTGSVTKTFDLPNQDRWGSVAINPGGSSFWAGSFDTAARFDLASGSVTASVHPADYILRAVGVVGEPRAATLGLAGIPTMSRLILVLLCLAMALVAVWRVA